MQQWTRLGAERAVAQAFRAPNASEGRAVSDAALVSPGSSLTRRRSLNRLLSRGLSSLLSATSEFYLQQTCVQFLMEDLVRQLGETRPEQPAPVIAGYWAAVARGTHVKGREFEFVHGCLLNRAAFLAQLHKTYAKVDTSMVITGADFAELLWCQCRDLPKEMLRHARWHLQASEDGHVRAPLRTFLSAFAVCFFYYEFLNKASEVYTDMQVKDSRVSSPRGNIRSESIANAMATDRVIAKLRTVVQQNGYKASMHITDILDSDCCASPPRFPAPPIVEVEQLVFKSANFNEVKWATTAESPQDRTGR